MSYDVHFPDKYISFPPNASFLLLNAYNIYIYIYIYIYRERERERDGEGLELASFDKYQED